MTKNSTLNVIYSIDKFLLGYISAVTKEDAQMVMFHLRDLSMKALTRLQAREGGYNCWSKEKYPGLDLPLRCVTKRTYDYQTYYSRQKAIDQQFKAANNLPPEYSPGWREVERWMHSNKITNERETIIQVEFKFVGKESNIRISEVDLEAAQIENLLLSNKYSEDKRDDEESGEDSSKTDDGQ